MNPHASSITLSEHGLLRVGSILELMPEAMPENPSQESSRYRAEVVKLPGGLNSVRWLWNGELHSLTSLSKKLEDEDGARIAYGIGNNWRRVGSNESIQDEAHGLQ